VERTIYNKVNQVAYNPRMNATDKDKVNMNYVQRASQLRDERLQQEEAEKRAATEKANILMEEEKKLRETEVVKNKDLLEKFKQFDGFPISNGTEKLGVDLSFTTNGIQFVRLKLASANPALMKSWAESGTPLLTASYFAKDKYYLLLRYERRNPHEYTEVGKYNDINELMEAVVIEVSTI